MRLLLLSLLTLAAFSVSAQTTYLPLGHEDYLLLDRLETKSGLLTNDVFTTLKPVSRKGMMRFLDNAVGNPADNALGESSDRYRLRMSAIDSSNVRHARSTSSEWAGGDDGGDGSIPSEQPILKYFYRTQADLYRVNNENFFLAVNPVLALRLTHERVTDNSPMMPRGGPTTSDNLFLNSRGVEIRGRIKDRVGFYTFLTDNQETPPTFVRNWVRAYDAVPNADYFQEPKPGKYDYLLARGYVDVAAIRDHVNVTFGYDKHHIGDGMRSLFLSDFASSGATFLRLNTRIWKLNYQNLYLELTPQYQRRNDRVLPHKYATVHHLSVNATRWLNIGLFEAVTFSRPDRFEFSYLNPVILYRHIERLNGSPDNAMLGLNFKAIALRRLQIYGQLLLDEFRSKELVAGNGWWGNKFGLQGGLKYFDVAGIKNLDLQLEGNVVRPFTYTHYDTLANWTHYNQPMAHPLGAGFAEAIGVVRYQPIRNLYLTIKGTFYKRGVDVDSLNFGNDIFRSYSDNRPGEYGFGYFNGTQARCAILNLNASYELRENLFIDLGVTHRNFSPTSFTPANQAVAPLSTTYGYGGFRLNMPRRDYDFF